MRASTHSSSFFFFNDTATTEIYTLSLHDALPIYVDKKPQLAREAGIKNYGTTVVQIGAKREEAKSTSEERSEEHTSELQSPCNLVCRLLLEKKKKQRTRATAALEPPSRPLDMCEP